MNHYTLNPPKVCLTLLAVKRAVTLESILPNQFWIGGELSVKEGQFYLSDVFYKTKLVDVNNLDFNIKPNKAYFAAVRVKKNDVIVTPSGFKLKSVGEIKILGQRQHFEGDFYNPKCQPELVKKWSEFLWEVESFFVTQGFFRAQTPTLVSCPGPEPTIDTFQTQFNYGQRGTLCHLPSSPEIHLKKMLAFGVHQVFEVKPSFRNNEITPWHEPEFNMLEWYRAFGGFEDLSDDLEGLINHLIQKFSPCDGHQTIQSFSLEELFSKNCEFSLQPTTTLEELVTLCGQLNIEVANDDEFNDVFFRIMFDKIEPFLSTIKAPVVIYNYPPSLAALSKLDTKGWASRFELYWKGVELANAFNELVDEKEQEKRLILDNLEKLKLNKPVSPIDLEFLQALRSGLPPTVGIALGLERLFAVIHNLSSISEFNLFSWSWRINK